MTLIFPSGLFSENAVAGPIIPSFGE